jgi:hypothetical protein
MDNDPKHTSGSTKNFLMFNNKNRVVTSAQSPVSIHYKISQNLNHLNVI